MTEIPENLRKRAEDARTRAAEAKQARASGADLDSAGGAAVGASNFDPFTPPIIKAESGDDSDNPPDSFATIPYWMRPADQPVPRPGGRLKLEDEAPIKLDTFDDIYWAIKSETLDLGSKEAYVALMKFKPVWESLGLKGDEPGLTEFLNGELDEMEKRQKDFFINLIEVNSPEEQRRIQQAAVESAGSFSLMQMIEAHRVTMSDAGREEDHYKMLTAVNLGLNPAVALDEDSFGESLGESVLRSMRDLRRDMGNAVQKEAARLRAADPTTPSGVAPPDPILPPPPVSAGVSPDPAVAPALPPAPSSDAAPSRERRARSAVIRAGDLRGIPAGATLRNGAISIEDAMAQLPDADEYTFERQRAGRLRRKPKRDPGERLSSKLSRRGSGTRVVGERDPLGVEGPHPPVAPVLITARPAPAEAKRVVGRDELLEAVSYVDVLSEEEGKKNVERAKLNPNTEKYVNELDEIQRKIGMEVVEKLAEGLKLEMLMQLERRGIEPSPYAFSKAWALWDIAKQSYLSKHPEENGVGYSPVDVFDRAVNAREAQRVRWEIIDRHVGWEYDWVHIGDAEYEADLAADGIIRKPNRHLSSKDYAELGEALRNII